ncbi:MAG: hypothetical protein IT198_08815 [Acidimicrobiia bacterium]|nr:hypothetical protein [Acidimicrobiia bacterium]
MKVPKHTGMFDEGALSEVVWFCSRCGHDVVVPPSLVRSVPGRVRTSPRCSVCSGAACGIVICSACDTLLFHHWGDPEPCPACGLVPDTAD